MAPTPARTFWQVLGRQVEGSGGDPLVTFYDEATGERVELSGTTYANWVAKTASLLQDELDLTRGDLVVVDLPTHWLGPVWLGAVWALGAVATDATDGTTLAEAGVVVSGPETLASHARLASGHVVACSLLPMGARFAIPPPPPVVDFGEVVWSQPDVLHVLDPATAEDPAWRDETGRLTQADLVALDGPPTRSLTTERPASRVGLGVLVAALRSGHGAVWVRTDPAAPPTRDRLEQLAGTERARRV